MTLTTLYRLLTLVLIFHFTTVQSQDSIKRYFIIGARYNYGKVIRHTTALSNEIKTSPMGFQLDASWHYKSPEVRDYCNCYPKLGLSFYYWDYRKPEILGHGMTLMVFAEPFFNAHKRVAFSLRAGLGLNYQDQPYDPLDNPLNVAYSTYFAFAALINLTANIRLNEHLNLVLAANYNHISNGGIKLPNKGLNYPGFSAGLDYSFKPGHFTRIRDFEDDQAAFKRKWRKDLGIYYGFRGITEDENLYSVYGIYAQLSWQFGRVSALPIGLSFSHDRAEVAKSKIYSSLNESFANELSIFTGYDYLLGKIMLSFNLGGYLYSPDRISPWLYQRYVLRVQLYKNFYTGMSLKAHGHIAEYFDVRLGITF